MYLTAQYTMPQVMTSSQNLTLRKRLRLRNQPGPVMWTVYLVGHLALEVHGELNHVVVGFPWEKDLARVQLIQSAANGPHVDPIVVRLPDDCKETFRL